MDLEERCARIKQTHIREGNHRDSDYFAAVRGLLELKPENPELVDQHIRSVYRQIETELRAETGAPLTPISFGTSGWRGILGKDIFVGSVRAVTAAIVKLYRELDDQREGAAEYLGVSSYAEARQRGCLVGHDNRFGGEILGRAIADYLSGQGFRVYYCGETTTGVLSAALLELGAAFSVNLTPSHNPLEYGGYKYNAADAGPAAAELTGRITRFAREIVADGVPSVDDSTGVPGIVEEIDSLELWQRFVRNNTSRHRLDYDGLLSQLAAADDLSLVVDCIHGASRLHLERLLGPGARRLSLLRDQADVAFGGIAPEPSSANLQAVTEQLRNSDARLKIGAIIDPDGDRIRFTDGTSEISMNQFGAMAYYFLHEVKGISGMVAKTVATSNLANSIAAGLGEELFEPRVGFKEFKPVIGKAVVMFEESDGISIIGHTPEKDAYIGLLLALAMTLALDQNLSAIRDDLERRYGRFCPDRDGVAVSLKGPELQEALTALERYRAGDQVAVGDGFRTIKQVIDIDGRKMIFEDDSWLMIRPSGTEPKVRFYVESRTPEGTGMLVEAARRMLIEAGVLEAA